MPNDLCINKLWAMDFDKLKTHDGSNSNTLSLNMFALEVIPYSTNSVDTFENIIVNEGKHELSLKTTTEGKKGNPIPKGLGYINKLYDLRHFGQGPRNSRTRKLTSMNEQSNLGTNHDPKMVSLGTNFILQQWSVFDHLIK